MKTLIAPSLGAVCIISGLAGAAFAQPSSSISVPSISSEEQAVYEAVIAYWLGKQPGRQLVSVKLGPPPTMSDPDFKECTKGLRMSATALAGQPSKSLASVHFVRTGIELIEPSRWSADDPGRGIAQGKSVEAAVKEGFSRSLISFSQIAFSENGKDALVKFRMVCGSLCGSGSTLRLHETGRRWAIVGRCENWIS
jgi:hypothetical protein